MFIVCCIIWSPCAVELRMLFYVVKSITLCTGTGIGGVFFVLKQKHSTPQSAHVGTGTY
jgi:hypothetical protein